MGTCKSTLTEIRLGLKLTKLPAIPPSLPLYVSIELMLLSQIISLGFELIIPVGRTAETIRLPAPSGHDKILIAYNLGLRQVPISVELDLIGQFWAAVIFIDAVVFYKSTDAPQTVAFRQDLFGFN